MSKAKRPDPGETLDALRASRQPDAPNPDPAAAAVYAEIEDDKTPDPIRQPKPRKTPLEVWRTTDKVTGRDVVTITGISPEHAETWLRIFDREAHLRDGPAWGHIY